MSRPDPTARRSWLPWVVSHGVVRSSPLSFILKTTCVLTFLYLIVNFPWKSAPVVDAARLPLWLNPIRSAAGNSLRTSQRPLFSVLHRPLVLPGYKTSRFRSCCVRLVLRAFRLPPLSPSAPLAACGLWFAWLSQSGGGIYLARSVDAVFRDGLHHQRACWPSDVPVFGP